MRRSAKIIWDEFIYGGHLCALRAPALMYVTSLTIGLRVDWAILLIGYLGTESVYLLDRSMSAEDDSATNQARSAHLGVLKGMRIALAMVMAGFCAYLLLQRGGLRTVELSLSVLVAGLLYDGFFKRISRTIPGFKSVFVALEWAYIVFLLALYNHAAIGVSVIAMAIVAFLVELANTSVCDIKDIKSDRMRGIRTLASELGIHRLMLWMDGTLVLMGVFTVTAVYLRWFLPSGWALLSIVPYAFIYMSLVSRGGGSDEALGLQRLGRCRFHILGGVRAWR